MTRGPWNRPRCVVAVEGLCFAGKTTLIRHLVDVLGPDLVTGVEYTDLGPLPPWPPADHDQVTAALRRLLGYERLRAAAVRAQLANCPDAVVLLDRSPLTLIAHEYGMQALNVPADPAGAATLFSQAAATGRILTPDAYLYLSVPDKVTVARRAARGPVAAHLDHPAVRARIDAACQAWLRLVPPARMAQLDGTLPPAAHIATVARFLDRLDGPPPPPWRMLTSRVPALAGARP